MEGSNALLYQLRPICMKPILGLLSIGIVGTLTYFVFFHGSVVEVDNSTILPELQEEMQSEEEVIEIDVLEKANQELERINAELDAEESVLLQEIEEREQRLEKIKELRMSF